MIRRVFVCAMFLNSFAAAGEWNLSPYRGKVVLLNFWATWCHGCKEELPWIVDYQTRFKSRGLAVIGISMDEDGWKSVKPFLKTHKLNYRVVIGTEDLARQYGGVDNMPKTILIGRDGKIAATYEGVIDRAATEAEIRKLLE